MAAIHFNSDCDDRQRRESIYAGDIFVYQANDATRQLCDYARELLFRHFHPYDPRTAQDHLSVDEYVAILRKLKPEFINSPKSKELVQQLLLAFDVDPQRLYFDLPRLRTSTYGGYLTSGMAYAYHPHRDTWFSAPMSQINWWLPVYEPSEQNCLALHTNYFNRRIQNSSDCFDYNDWVNNGRRNAHQHVKKDERVQPQAIEPLDLDADVRIVTPPGGVQIFSAAHLHSSVPNTSKETRLSIDFRTVHLDDIQSRRGAKNLDNHCRGTNLGDFIRVDNLSPIATELVEDYARARCSN